MTVSETSDKMVEALPYPFCGSKPVVQDSDGNATHPYSAIHCANDECLGPKTTAAFLDDALFQWNTRPRTAALSDQVVVPKPCSLATLRQAIIDNTHGDLFWIGEILLNELEKETGFKGPAAPPPSSTAGEVG